MAGKADLESLVIRRTPTLGIAIGQVLPTSFIDPQRVRSFGTSIARPDGWSSWQPVPCRPGQPDMARAADAAIIVARPDQTPA
jgi:hypothetical protein